MKGSRLFQLLRTLSRKEMTRFSQFAHSPYHNKHKAVQLLVAELTSQYPDFTTPSCKPERLGKIALKKDYSPEKLAVLFTYTTRLLEAFFAEERFLQQPFDQQLYLLQNFRQKNLPEFYQRQLARTEKAIDTQTEQDSHYQLIRYELAAEADRYFAQASRHEEDHNIQVKQDYLDRYYIAEKLKDACEMTVRRRILRVDYSPKLLESVLTEVNENWNLYQQMPAIAVYFELYHLLNNAPNFTFDRVRTTLTNLLDRFHREEQQNLFNYLQNYCIQQINKGQSDYLHRAFQTYQTQLDRDLLLIHGLLPEWHYKNIVAIGLRLEAHDWTYQFIEEYKAKLPDAVRENAYAFNLASYFYSIRELEQVLQLLSRVEYTDVRYYIAEKSLLMRTYYDLDEYEALLSLSEAFKQFLKRNQVMTDDRVRAFQNLLRYTQKAMRLKTQRLYRERQTLGRERTDLQKQIEQEPYLINRDWLLERIMELT